MLPSSAKVLRSAGFYCSSAFPGFSYLFNRIMEDAVDEALLPVEYVEDDRNYPEYNEKHTWYDCE